MSANENIYQQAILQGLENALSLERFQHYLDWAEGDKEQAFALYAFNMRVSETQQQQLEKARNDIRSQR